MKIGLISGSNRKGSFNKALLEYIEESYRTKLDMEFLDISQLPLYSQDIERDPIESVESLRAAVKSCDAIIFATPEHNGSVSAALKNFLDWMSRIEFVLMGKPVMIIGASMGMFGTVNSQNHLKDILSSPMIQSKVLPGNQICVPAVHEKVEDGKLKDSFTEKKLKEATDNFIDWIENFK